MKIGASIAILFACAGAFFAGFVGGAKSASAAEPCRLIEPTPIDAQVWLYRGLDACVSKCGDGAFHAEVEPMRLACDCPRVPNLGIRKVKP